MGKKSVRALQDFLFFLVVDDVLVNSSIVALVNVLERVLHQFEYSSSCILCSLFFLKHYLENAARNNYLY